MLEVLERLKNNRFIRSVLLVAGGAALAQGITVGVTPLLTRIFTPNDFGTLAVFISALSILLAVSSFRFELAIPIVRLQKEARGLVFLCFCILLVFSILMFFLLFAFCVFFKDIDWFYVVLLPLGLFFGGAFQVFNYWSIRVKDFKTIARANVYRSLLQSSSQVAAGVAVGGGLIFGYVISQIVGGYGLYSRVLAGFRFPTIRRLMVLALRNKRFPLFSMPSGLLNAGALHIAPFFLVSIYGAASAGFFSLAQRAMGAPMAFIGTAIASVYLSELPKMKQSDPCRILKFYIVSCRNLLAVGLPMVLAATAALWWGVDLIFGDVWSGAKKYILCLAPMFLGQFVIAPLSQTLNVLNRQDLQLIWDAARLLVPNCAFLLGLWGVDVVVALAFYGVLMLLMYAINFFMTICAIRCYMLSLPGN